MPVSDEQFVKAVETMTAAAQKLNRLKHTDIEEAHAIERQAKAAADVVDRYLQEFREFLERLPSR